MTDTTSAGDGGALADLIARLERAEGASRDLDDEIDDMALERGWRQERAVVIYGSPDYTSSLDAALTLVPEGWRWSLDWTQRPHYRDCGRADLYAPGRGIEPPDVQDVYAATPAIALCIAALKARSATP